VQDRKNSTFNDMPYAGRKLCIEVVPKTLWGKNLHRDLDRAEWDRVRRSIYKKYDYACSVCGRRDTTMHAHEVWSYDDKAHVQTLVGIICLCSLCDRVKHIGLTEVLAKEGKVNWKVVVDHYCAVNKCDEDTFNLDRRAALRVHSIRSRFEWQQVIGDYNQFLV
jgi:hypothetical protein